MARPQSPPLSPAATIAEVASSLGSAATGAHIDPSAEIVLPHLNVAALSAVAQALAGTPLSIACIRGAVDPEAPGWRQLVLAIREPGEIGSEEWLATLDMAGCVMEAAVEAHPELSHEIASQITFEV